METTQKKTLIDLINSVSSKLESTSQQAKEYLVSLAEKGLLENHQSKGSIEGWAVEILRKLRKTD
jgi:hypothetical protein